MSEEFSYLAQKVADAEFFQRPQIYGNLWQTNLERPLPQVPYERFDIAPR